MALAGCRALRRGQTKYFKAQQKLLFLYFPSLFVPQSAALQSAALQSAALQSAVSHFFQNSF